MLMAPWGAWFLPGGGGIQYDTENPGYKHFTIDPEPDASMDNVSGSYDSVYGKIVSDWTLSGAVLHFMRKFRPIQRRMSTFPRMMRRAFRLTVRLTFRGRHRWMALLMKEAKTETEVCGCFRDL